MRFTIEYTVVETVDVPGDDPEIVGLIVDGIVVGAIEYLERGRFEAKLKKIERKP